MQAPQPSAMPSAPAAARASPLRRRCPAGASPEQRRTKARTRAQVQFRPRRHEPIAVRPSNRLKSSRPTPVAKTGSAVRICPHARCGRRRMASRPAVNTAETKLRRCRCNVRAAKPRRRLPPHDSRHDGFNRTPARPARKLSDPRRQVSWLTARAVRPAFPTGDPGQWQIGQTSPFTVAGAAAGSIQRTQIQSAKAPRSLFTRASTGTVTHPEATRDRPIRQCGMHQ